MIATATATAVKIQAGLVEEVSVTEARSGDRGGVGGGAGANRVACGWFGDCHAGGVCGGACWGKFCCSIGGGPPAATVGIAGAVGGTNAI